MLYFSFGGWGVMRCLLVTQASFCFCWTFALPGPLVRFSSGRQVMQLNGDGGSDKVTWEENVLEELKIIIHQHTLAGERPFSPGLLLSLFSCSVGDCLFLVRLSSALAPALPHPSHYRELHRQFVNHSFLFLRRFPQTRAIVKSDCWLHP